MAKRRKAVSALRQTHALPALILFKRACDDKSVEEQIHPHCKNMNLLDQEKNENGEWKLKKYTYLLEFVLPQSVREGRRVTLLVEIHLHELIDGQLTSRRFSKFHQSAGRRRTTNGSPFSASFQELFESDPFGGILPVLSQQPRFKEVPLYDNSLHWPFFEGLLTHFDDADNFLSGAAKFVHSSSNKEGWRWKRSTTGSYYGISKCAIKWLMLIWNHEMKVVQTLKDLQTFTEPRWYLRVVSLVRYCWNCTYSNRHFSVVALKVNDYGG